MAEETKVIYHIDDEDTPYLVKLPVGPDRVTLADFKNVLNRPNYKFFFKVKQNTIRPNSSWNSVHGR